MSRRKTLDLGNIVIAKLIPAKRLGVPHTEQDLTEILSTFNYEDVLITLSRINLSLQRSKDLSKDERNLKVAFCRGIILNAIDACPDIKDDFVFSRQGTLRLLDKCALMSDSQSTNTITNIKAMNDLAKAYLIVNGLLDIGSSALSTSEDEEERNMLVNSIPFQEYATNEAPQVYTKHLVVRTSELLRLLQEESSTLDVNEIFSHSTGLTLQDYQYLIFLIFTHYWTLSPEDIAQHNPLTGKSLFFNPNIHSDDLTPLFQKLLLLISVSIDDLNSKTNEYAKFIDEFRLWRDYPLLKINENKTICVDFYFLLEKIQTGAFWLIRKWVRGSSEEGTFEDLWGDVFENYSTSIIKRGITSQSSSIQERVIVNPKYDQKPDEECVDAAIFSDDSLTLVECKSTLLSAASKFSGDFNNFYEGAKSVKKGIEQLGKAVQHLGNKDENQRHVVKDIDICKIKKIYPVLVISDRLLSYLFMNQVLNSKFEAVVQKENLVGYLEVMPLSVLTIMELELLEPYMQDKSLNARLDEWLDWLKENPRFGFTAFMHDMINKEQRINQFMDQGFAQFHSEVQRYSLERGIS